MINMRQEGFTSPHGLRLINMHDDLKRSLQNFLKSFHETYVISGNEKVEQKKSK